MCAMSEKSTSVFQNLDVALEQRRDFSSSSGSSAASLTALNPRFAMAFDSL